MSRVIYASNDDFSLSTECINGYLFVHVSFTRFSKSVLNTLRDAWEHLLVASYFDGWEEIFTYTKDPRIVNIIGGAQEVGQDDPDLANLGMRMYKWELK